MRRSVLLGASTLLLTAASFVGCTPGSKFDLAPVSGRVTLDGQPVNRATVMFMPKGGRDDEAGFYSRGETDEDGRFSLKTTAENPREGAVVGKHRVLISTLAVETDPSIDNKTLASMTAIPFPYNDYQRTPLTFTVEPGGTDEADFELSTCAGP